MSEKFYVEIDASPWMDSRGVEVTVFVGNEGEPAYSNVTSFEDLVDQELESHTSQGRLTNEYGWHGYDNIAAAEEFVIALEEAAARARALFEDLKDEK